MCGRSWQANSGVEPCPFCRAEQAEAELSVERDSDNWKKHATDALAGGTCPVCFATDEEGHKSECPWGQAEAERAALKETVIQAEMVIEDQKRELKALYQEAQAAHRRVDALRACHESELGVCQEHCPEVTGLRAEVERKTMALEEIIRRNQVEVCIQTETKVGGMVDRYYEKQDGPLAAIARAALAAERKPQAEETDPIECFGCPRFWSSCSPAWEIYFGSVDGWMPAPGVCLDDCPRKQEPQAGAGEDA
jgi:hypothetical protein